MLDGRRRARSRPHVVRRARPGAGRSGALPAQKPIYRDFRAGDVRHSLADISKAQQLLGFAPTHSIRAGLDLAMDWYRRNVV